MSDHSPDNSPSASDRTKQPAASQIPSEDSNIALLPPRPAPIRHKTRSDKKPRPSSSPSETSTTKNSPRSSSVSKDTPPRPASTTIVVTLVNTPENEKSTSSDVSSKTEVQSPAPLLGVEFEESFELTGFRKRSYTSLQRRPPAAELKELKRSPNKPKLETPENDYIGSPPKIKKMEKTAMDKGTETKVELSPVAGPSEPAPSAQESIPPPDPRDFSPPVEGMRNMRVDDNESPPPQ